MRKWSQYKIKYENEWESDLELKDWIEPVPGDERTARCKICDVTLAACHAGLCRHAQDPKHIKKLNKRVTCHDTTSVDHAKDVKDGKGGGGDVTGKDKKLFSYQSKWNTDPLFSDWVQSVQGDDTVAHCRYCDTIIRAHRASLERHRLSAKHISQSSDDISPVTVGNEIVKSDPSAVHADAAEEAAKRSQWIEASANLSREGAELDLMCENDDDDGATHLTDLSHSTQRMKRNKLMSTLAVEDLHGLAGKPVAVAVGNEAEEMEPPTKKLKLPASEFQIEWLENQHLRDWLEKCANDDTRARCRVCRVTIPANIKQLVRHATSAKHTSNVEPQASNRDTQLTVESTSDVDESEAAILNNLIEQYVLADGDSDDQRQKPDGRKQRRSKGGIDWSRYKKVYKPEWEKDPVLEGWLEPVPEDKTKAMCKFCKCLIRAHYHDLCMHATTNKHGKMMWSNPEFKRGTTAVDASTDATSVLSEPDADGGVSEQTKTMESLKNETGASGSELKIDNDWCEENSSDKEVQDLQDSFSQIDGRKLRVGKRNWSKYKKCYRREWEFDPRLKGWISPVIGNPLKAACRYCECILRAHYTDLCHHADSIKHQKHEEWYHSEEAMQPTAAFNPVMAVNPVYTVSDRKRPPNENAPSGCYVVQSSSWSRYRKRYCKIWEQDPLLRGWIMPVPGDELRARCRYCRILLRAHYNDLRNHARTTKHASNVAFGGPPGEVLTSTVPAGGRHVSSRASASGKKKKGSVTYAYDEVAEPAAPSVNVFNLDRPDESLGSLRTLVNLTQFNWNEGQGPETTLLIGDGIHLDEQLAASLPQIPGLRFRVRTEPRLSDYDSSAGGGKAAKDKNALYKDLLSDKQLSNETLRHLARSVTLWEFLTLKVSRVRNGTERRVRIADVLTEFSELHKKVKNISQQALSPWTESNEQEKDENGKSTRKTLMLESKELAQCLGLSPGRYVVEECPELQRAASVDSHPLVPPIRKRSKSHRPTAQTHTVEYQQQASAQGTVSNIGGSELRQYIIEPLSEVDSTAIQHGSVDGSSQRLVLVAAESGELLLQCDLNDYHNLVNTATSASGADVSAVGSLATIDDLRSLVGARLSVEGQ